jgi:hypothetical protein
MSQSCQDAQQSGLPGSVVAQNHMQPASIEFRVHAAQRSEAAELLDEIANADD